MRAEDSVEPTTLRGTHGTYRFESRARGGFQAVLIADPAATNVSGLASDLRAKGHLVFLIETVKLDRLGRTITARKAVDAAIQECAYHHPEVLDAAWILAAAGKHARQFVDLAFARPERFEGLLAYGDGLRTSWLPDDLEHATKMHVVHLDEQAGARDVRERLNAAGLSSRITRSRPRGRQFSGFVQDVWRTGRWAQRVFEGVPDYGQNTIETKTADGLWMTGDLYEVDKGAPTVLLFHKEERSRGEYGLLAERLGEAGFNCLAVDARTGGPWQGVVNRTAQRAKKKSLAAGPADGRPDLERAIAWVRELGFRGKLVLLGTRCSASLSIIIAAKTEGLAAVVAFSPGDWIPPQGSVLDAARKLDVPTLVIARRVNEGQARQVFRAIASTDKELDVRNPGVVGAAGLYRGRDAAELWKLLITFLSKHTE